MAPTAPLERILERWAAALVAVLKRRVEGLRGVDLDDARVARTAAQTGARDAATRVVTAVLAAVIIERARKSTVATMASRVATAQIIEGYPVNMFHLCVSDDITSVPQV